MFHYRIYETIEIRWVFIEWSKEIDTFYTTLYAFSITFLVIFFIITNNF